METLKAFYDILNGRSEFFNRAVLSIFSGPSGWYLLVPAVILLMFLASGICITIILARQRWKEGMDDMDRKLKNKY